MHSIAFCVFKTTARLFTLGLLTAGNLLGASLPSPPGEMVQLKDGRRFHLVCEGTAAPTVVLESGSGEGWYVWSLVQHQLSRSVRICSYDRAGIGWSDPRDGRSIKLLNEDMHELLARAGEKPPFVLVGHSIGGVLVRRYARSYPDDVAGLVLVDRAHENFDRDFPPTPEEQQRVPKAREARRQQIEEWRSNGKWPEMEFDAAVPAELTRLLKPRSASGNWWDARFAESGLPDADALEGEGHESKVPLVVITANWPRPSFRTEERHAAWTKARAAVDDKLAARAPWSRHITVNSHHSVQLEHPEVVIRGILELVDHVRAATANQR